MYMEHPSLFSGTASKSGSLCLEMMSPEEMPSLGWAIHSPTDRSLEQLAAGVCTPPFGIFWLVVGHMCNVNGQYCLPLLLPQTIYL